MLLHNHLLAVMQTCIEVPEDFLSMKSTARKRSKKIMLGSKSNSLLLKWPP